MTTISIAPPLTRREYAYAFFLASILVFATLLCGGRFWAMNTPRILVDLGSPENYSLDKPNRVNLNLKDGSSRTV